MDLTQEQIDVLSQNLRKKHLRVELLDQDMVTIDSIEGIAIGGSITANANNDIRRSGNVELAIPINHAKDTLFDKLDGFTIEAGGKIWLDRNIKLYVGIEDITSSEENIVWYKLGVFLIDNPTRSFSAQSYIISFSCVDLMAKLTGQRQGQLTGQTTLIEKGYNSIIGEESVYTKTRLADALISTITELGGFSRYTIYPIPPQYEYLPYDVKVGVGSTVYSLLKELMNIISTWEMFFDLDGVFVVRPIPSGENDIVYPIDETQYISNDLSVDFQNVKNQVVVYGRINSLDYFAENNGDEINVVYKDNEDGTTSTLQLYYSAINMDSITISGTNFGFHSPDIPNLKPIQHVEIYNGEELIVSAPMVKFENATSSFGVEYFNSIVEARTIIPDEIYFIRIYDGSVTTNADGLTIVDFSQPVTFEFMGKQSVSHCLVNDNIDSPFYVNKGIKQQNYYAGTEEYDYEGGTSNYVLRLNNVDDVTMLTNGVMITFMASRANVENQKVDVYDSTGNKLLSDVPIVQNAWDTSVSPTTRNPILPNKLYKDYTIWMLQYEISGDNEWFVLKGRCPNVLTKICSGGEYDNIYADQLAYERCLYELFVSSNLNDSISLGVVPNYLLDVNCKIKYNKNSGLPILLQEDMREQNVNHYMVKQISYPLGVGPTAQTISAIRIYDSKNLVGITY